MMDKPDPDVAVLLQALRRPEGGIRDALALVHRGNTSIPALIEATTDAQPRIRGLASFALGELGQPSQEVVRALRVRLDDDDHEVRFVAARAIGNLKKVPSEVLERLDSMRRSDPDAPVRGAAEAALLAIDPTHVRPLQNIDDLLTTIEDLDPQQREAAIDSIGMIGAETSDPARQERVEKALAAHLLHDSYFQSRLSAALAMWKIGRASPRVIDSLVHALGDRDLRVQAMAAQVLGNFGPKASGALPILKTLAADAKKPELAAIAQNVIGKIGP